MGYLKTWRRRFTLFLAGFMAAISCAYQRSYECHRTEFDCRSALTQCINASLVGDGKIDCSNGFDEGCPSDYFVCHDRSGCLEPRKFMDGVHDCFDKSDEPCFPSEYFCEGSKTCIDRCKVQDGVSDCPDGEDEECSPFQFHCRCGRPRCIDLARFNNSRLDCLDGSDEPSSPDYLSDRHCVAEHARNVLPSEPIITSHLVLCDDFPGVRCNIRENEVCLVILGIPQCTCRPGYIRLRHDHACFPTSRTVWRMVEMTDRDRGRSLQQSVTRRDHCSPSANSSCHGRNEECSKTGGVFDCNCKAGHLRHPKNHKCVELIDECSNRRLNDCDPKATCIDNPISYECLCKEGFLDVSPSPRKYPGRNCTPLVDECKDTRTNDCDPNAHCLDLPSGYTCRCREGFRDVSPEPKQNPGRRCSALKDECDSPQRNNCSANSVCVDTADSYGCRCKKGFVDRSPDPIRLPGRVCLKVVNECKDASLNDCDKLNAHCIDTVDSFTCQCKTGFIDQDPQRPGRICTTAKNPCLDRSLNDCANDAICFPKDSGLYECACAHGFVDLSSDKRKPGRICRQLMNECQLGMHHCDPIAICIDTAESYTCVCPDGWIDASEDPVKRPGRKCVKRQNECLDSDKNECSPDADCLDTEHGYLCHCHVGYVDVSLKYGKQPGRICKEMTDECALNYHDCSIHAECIDTAESYLCRCKDGYADRSAQADKFPGRICVAGPFLSDFSPCKVDDPLSCNVALLEVCLFSNGTYKCGCPQGVSRLPDGRCKAINECKEARLNDCDKNAECIDEPESYTCQCKPGFVDASPVPLEKAGRICKALVNECAEPKKYDVNCDQRALCVDTDLSFTCRCLPGYVDVSESYNELPGRRCKEAINECLDRKLHDCSLNALCEDAKEGYTCRCREGFVDVSPDVDHFPGRACVLPRKMAPPIEETYNNGSCDPKNPSACNGAEKCKQIDGRFVCHCPPNAERFEDGTCTMVNACDRADTNECDKNAVCSNILDSYSCQCKPGFIDISEDPVSLPGRKCKEVVNECASVTLNDCSPHAECVDTREGYACSCKPGYLDVSSRFDLPAGRRCFNTTNECAVRDLNTCDDNADCIDLPEGYTCQCVPGYVDVSSNAKLPPGRVCTIQTYCPSQPTDLMFLLDGSGSIGSSVFRDEVLRFLKDFISLFNVSANKTRVAIIQFSDQIRHELDFSQSASLTEVEESLNEIHYLTGLTKTGNAIQDMLEVGFSTERGARPLGSGVHRVAVVITDGRSQDVVTFSAIEARRNAVLVFAVGVTDHVSEAELIEIAGAKERVFLVKDFAGLDVRLRSLIQKAACPPVTEEWSRTSQCSLDEPNACDASKNEMCSKVSDSFSLCDCPDGFERHPATNVCGGVLCNPEVKTSCAYPEVCRKTPYGNHRCVCPTDHFRSRLSGHCVSLLEEAERKMRLSVGCSLLDNSTCPPGEMCVKATDESNQCVCPDGLERNAQTNICAPPGSCDPYKPSCDERRHEVCMKNEHNQYVCQCPKFGIRDPVTQVCLINECLARLDDCDEKATCIDTRDGYLCQCPAGFLDLSNDPKRAGRVCIMMSTDHCSDGKRHCSPNADCVNLADGFLCRCKPGYIDFSPNPRLTPGMDCREKRDECSDPALNDCSPDALCIDTDEGFICMCKPNFIDRYEFSKPGRFCEPAHANRMCEPGRNDCDRNAECFAKGANDFVCVCPSGYQDKSPNPLSRPGRVCLPYIPVCDNPNLNDCDKEHAVCTEAGESYSCSCIAGFLDISPDPERPGRLCKKLVDECFEGTHDCARDGGLCEDTPDSYKCSCASGYADVSPDVENKPGRICKPLRDECTAKSNDCSVNANCIDTADHYTCACKKGYRDVSADPVNVPGRTCIRLINECEHKELNDCSPNAWCTDTLDSYQCHCKRGYVDRSPDMLRYPGRICLAKKVNECYLHQHDCSSNAICKDEEEGYSCRCRPGFVDRSPNALALPGRVCEAEVTPQQDSGCNVEDAHSCDVTKNEVCRLVDNEPQCACPKMYERNPDTGSCTVINECLLSELNNCSANAVCVDQTTGYTCECKEGFKDVSPDKSAQPGRICKPLVNECEYEHLNDCHQEAECTDLEDGYQCRCNPGFVDISANAGLASGRACHKPTDECSDPALNSCDRNALCLDDLFGYRCQCPVGYLDVSPVPTSPGRACRKIVNECSSGENDCDPIAFCVDTPDSYKCICPGNSTDVSPNPTFPGRVCRTAVDNCGSKMHDCDANADCSNTDTSFVCTCKDGFVDRSPNPSRPGRFCVKLVNECEDGSAQCSPNADCRDLQDGYTCECKDGFVDRSPITHQPGRICTRPDVCPSNHDCSSSAVCEPSPDGPYTCRCVPGYVDHSPPESPGRKCVRANECRDPTLNNCSRNALCTKLTVGYRCECLPGYEDRSPSATFPGVICELPQPSFEETVHPCQDPSLNDCSLQGTCKSNGSPEGYTCECPPDFVDLSPDPLNKPGRVCALKLPVCLNRTRNDCHKNAICQETAGEEGYTCRCRDGYIDQSVDPQRPGRDCKEKINECLDSNLNDCDSTAVCEDSETGYSCRCPLGYLDQSPDASKPGRLCTKLINECMMPAMNNCSRFADCIDQPIGYRCSCRDGYHDMNPRHAGTSCILILNECESFHLNDCDRRAVCVDLVGGYNCSCPQAYEDRSPDPEKPGRICRVNECDFEALHECDPNAICKDTEDGYICYCKEGFVDVSPDPQQPGKRCITVAEEPVIVSTRRPVTIPIELTPCALRFCNKTLGEFCVAGIRCECPPGHVRPNDQTACEQAAAFAFPLRVIRRNQTMLIWSSHYGNPDDVRYVEIVNLFNKGISQAVATTRLADPFILSKVNSITPPRLHNSSWVDGLVFNYTVFMKPNDGLTPQAVWNEIMQSIQRSNFSIGGTDLYIDRFQINPFVGPKPPSGLTCGPVTCNQALGEVCVNNLVCTCPYGQGRKEETHPCKELQSYTIPLLVAYKGDTLLKFDDTFKIGTSPANTELEDAFSKGVNQAYRITPVWPNFIRIEVNEILDPSKFSWSDQAKGGLLFNFTVHFEKGTLEGRQTAWEELFHSCASTNYSIGGTQLFIDPLQPNPFDPCQWTDCFKNALCNSIGTDAYECRCPDGFVDLNPALPGRQCVEGEDYNECASDTSNNCSVNAICIDKHGGYSCECKPGYVDISPSDGPGGRICILDYCADLPFCPVNTTCVNIPEIEGARCECNSGYLDIRGSPFVDRFPPDTYCIAMNDVDECALGLTNCSSVAICTNEDEGYSCSCPPGYVDGNPSQPGRVCAAASCSLCNDHGDCVRDPETDEIGCKCHPWYTGERCDTDVRVILLFIFAAIFFLITLCCLLYFCLKCRCVRRKSLWYREPLLTQRKAFWPWSTMGASSSSESQADISAMSTSPFGIAGAKSAGHYPDVTIPRAKLKAAAQGSGGSTGEATEAGYMRAYLDAPDGRGWKIPRARLSNDGVEREGSESVVFSDVNAGLLAGRSQMQGAGHTFADTGSASSEYSDSLYEEEIIKSTKTTNVKRTEVRKIVRPEVHSAELVAVSGNEAEGNSESAEHAYNSSSAFGTVRSEKDCGQTVIEVHSIGPNGSATLVEGKIERRIGRDGSDLDSASIETVASSLPEDLSDEKHDQQVLIKRSHEYRPHSDGKGSKEKDSSRVVTKTSVKRRSRLP